jgi:hypothetical protein
LHNIAKTSISSIKLSENVRTIHRLGPIFFAHFVQILALALLANVMYFNGVRNASLMKLLPLLYMLFHSMALLVIVVAVIL